MIYNISRTAVLVSALGMDEIDEDLIWEGMQIVFINIIGFFWLVYQKK